MCEEVVEMKERERERKKREEETSGAAKEYERRGERGVARVVARVLFQDVLGLRFFLSGCVCVCFTVLLLLWILYMFVRKSKVDQKKHHLQEIKINPFTGVVLFLCVCLSRCIHACRSDPLRSAPPSLAFNLNFGHFQQKSSMHSGTEQI
jgi:hypothetical protein